MGWRQAANPVPEAQPKIAAPPAHEESTEDFLSNFVLDLEHSLTDSPAAEKHPQPVAHPAEPAPVQRDASSNGEMQDPDSTSVLSDILSDLQDDEAEAA